MSKHNSLMRRFTSSKKEKVGALVERSRARQIPHFSAMLQGVSISSQEEDFLHALLEKYQTSGVNVHIDLQTLTAITSEVYAISNQSIVLHGERIKRAQTLFKVYREGAFSTWLIRMYGNRQTPYNFMQYFELYAILPLKLQKIMDKMPRQVIYTLSTRATSQEQKEAFIKNYRGETKNELLEKLRQIFPLAQQDKRNSDQVKRAQNQLKGALKAMKDPRFSPNEQEREACQQLIQEIKLRLGFGSHN